jgi:hypothetical protein
MKTKLNLILILLLAVTIGACNKLKESFEKKVDEKVNEQVEKTKEDANKKLQEMDSTLKSAGEEINKEVKIQEALDEDNILNDNKGQWVKSAEVSSTYAIEDVEDAPWSSFKLKGKPDVEEYGDNGKAWASKEQNKGIEWLKLTFPKAVYATDVRIRQSFNPGAIIKIELFDDKGKSHTIWEGVDKTKYAPNTIKYFTASFEKTDYKTKIVKITLATNSVNGWNEIDAVQLVGE